MPLFNKIAKTTQKGGEIQPSHSNFLALKDLNSKISALKLLVQDYSMETMPQWVNFATTFICNLRCPFCQNHGTEENRKKYNDASLNMQHETLIRLAKESLPWAKEFSLSLSGEPLLTSHIEEVLDEVAPFGAKLDLVTNGTLLTKKILSMVLPLSGKMQISIDAATEYTYERLRVGAKFKKTIHNIRLLTRTIELLGGDVHPQTSFSFTIMGSNIRDLPEILKLASILKVPEVNGCFIVLHEDNQHIRNEDVKLHKQLYNAYYDQSHVIAEKLKIRLNIPDPFPGVRPDANIFLGGEGMIINQLSEDYYKKSPSPADFLDQRMIDIEAAEIVDMIKVRIENKEVIIDEISTGKLKFQLQDSFKELLEHYEDDFSNATDETDEKIKYCEYLHNKIYIYPEGYVVPCCTIGRPILGDINNNTIREVWNGNLYNEFRQKFYSPNPNDCCKGCVHVQHLNRSDFVKSFL